MKTRFLYLTQSNNERSYLLHNWKRTPIVFNFSTTDINNYESITMPSNTTWTAGRNIMINYANKFSDEYDYVILCDDDIEIDFDIFEQQIVASSKGIIYPNYVRYKNKSIREILSQQINFFGTLDNCCVAIKTSILDKIQYDTRFDEVNWWASALIFQGFLRTHMFNDVDKVDVLCNNTIINGIDTPTSQSYPKDTNKHIICHYMREKLKYNTEKIVNNE